jgi:Flp pilus assembly protein TadG
MHAGDDARRSAAPRRRAGGFARALWRWRELLRARSGAAVVEFATLAPVFFLLVVGIVEVPAVLFTNSMIEDAARDAARKIRTGEAQQSADPLAAFQAELCADLLNFIPCSSLHFDVRSFADFTSVSVPPVQYDQNGQPTNTVFQPGTSEQITVVRVQHRWDFFTPLIGELMSTDGTNSMLLQATAAFRNEPYLVQ